MFLRADPSSVKSAYLSHFAQEPVLEFYTASDAAQFRALYRNGRIFDHDRKKVYLPRPRNLVSTRVAARGDFAFVFPSHEEAKKWWESLYGIRKMFEFDKTKPERYRTVYMGRQTH